MLVALFFPFLKHFYVNIDWVTPDGGLWGDLAAILPRDYVTWPPAGILPSAKIPTLQKDLFIFPLVELFLPNMFYNYRVSRDKAKHEDMGRQAQLQLNIAQMISCAKREPELR